MKNLKKVIALIAVLALTLSTVALGATYSDVAEDSAYSVAVESLSKLGIVTGYEDGTYGPEKAVTRAEMAALIARIQGYEETASAQTATVFTDVPADFWGSGYVAAASNMGIVNGYGDGTFGPDDAVKYEQAVTMIMRTLGYEPFAAANGGYPTGYLAAAQRYGLTKNVSNAVSGTDANRGTIAQLLYNGIDTPIMAQSKWGTAGDIEYTIYDGTGNVDYKTLMSENLGVVKVKGVVVANSVTGIEDASALGIDTEEVEEVSIRIVDVYDTTDDNLKNAEKTTKQFMVGDTDIVDALGYSVVAYVVEDEAKADEYVVVSYAKDSSTNSVVEFTLDQFDGVIEETKEVTKEVDGKEVTEKVTEIVGIDYYKNSTDNKTSELKFDKNGVSVVKNFNDTTLAALKAIKPTESGKVTLIDNNNTNGYDVAIIEVGTSLVVKKATDEKITFFEGGTFEIDPEDTEKIISLTKDGKAIAPSSLVEWDVVTVVANAKIKDATYVKAEVVGSTVVGKVTSTKKSTSSDYGTAYKIEGTFYDIAEGVYAPDDIEIGAGGTFYVDKYGKIVAYNEDATLVGGTASNYALVIKADTTTSFGSKVVQVQLLTANGADVYELADELEIDEKEIEITKDNAETYKTQFTPEANKPMLIKYNTNSNGEIKEIFTAASDEFDVSAEKTGAEYDADNIELGSLSLEEDVDLFLIDWDGAEVDDVKSKMGTLADLEDGEKYSYQSVEVDDEVELVIITDGIGSIGKSATIAVITDIAEEDVDGADVLSLSFYQNGEAKTLNTEEDVEISWYDGAKDKKLTIGDVVKVKVVGNVITAIDVVLDFADGVRTASEVLADEIKAVEEDDEEVYSFSYAAAYSDKHSFKPANNEAYSVRLDRADYVYVIDAGGKDVSVDTGDYTDFDYDEDEKDNNKKDYVFVREYDGTIEVVVVKAID